MKKYIAQVNMIQEVQVEFELPEWCDQHTIEIQAEIEAKAERGDADRIEVIKVEESLA